MDLLWSEEHGYYQGVAASDEEDLGDDSAKLAQALAAIKRLTREHSQLQKQVAEEKRQLPQRARAAAVQLLRDQNAGVAEVSVVSVRETAREKFLATSFKLQDNFSLHSWDRSAGLRTEMSSPPVGKDFQRIFFQNKMRTEDVRRVGRATADPTIWRNAPLPSPQVKSILGSDLLAQDTKLRLQQESALKPVRPVITALDWLAAIEQDIPAAAENTLHSLEQARQCLSDSVHLVAHSVTALQRQRDQLLADKRAGGSTALPDELDGSDWCVDYTALLKEADNLRSMRKDLGALPKNGQRQPREPRGAVKGAGGALSNRQKKKDAWAKRNKERGGEKKKQQLTPQQQSKRDKAAASTKKPDKVGTPPSADG